MRHAKAEQGNFETTDFDRKLADKGKNDTNTAAKVLKTHVHKIDLIVSSSSKRTAKTAKIVAENFTMLGRKTDFENEQNDQLRSAKPEDSSEIAKEDKPMNYETGEAADDVLPF